MPTTGTSDLEILKRLCADPCLLDHEAAAGIVLDEPEPRTAVRDRRVETVVAVERAIAAVRTDRWSTWSRLAALPDGDGGAEDVS